MTEHLHPLDVISFFVSKDGRTTNMELVRHLAKFLSGSPEDKENVVENKTILKMVTSQIASVRRQGTRDNATPTSEGEGGKLLVMKKQFRKQTAGEIWSSLLLSLSKEDIERLIGETKKRHIDTTEETNIIHIDTTEETNGSHMETAAAEESEHHRLENTIEKIQSEKTNEDSTEVIQLVETEQRIERLDTRKDEIQTDQNIQRLEDSSQQKEVTFNKDVTQKIDQIDGEEVFLNYENSGNDEDKSKSVKNLRKAYDQYANESNLSLMDHAQKNKEMKRVKLHKKSKSSTSNEVNDWRPLTPEGRSWLQSAMRGDYATLSRLANQDSSIVNSRDPATGYTALHWAAKLGHAEVVKLCAGRYNQEPDVRSRGGYTPLMLAGMFKRQAVYELLTLTYKSDPHLRDYSGVRVDSYRATFPQEADDTDQGGDKESQRSRTKVARSATQNFMADLRSSVRDVRGSIKANMRTSRTFEY